MTAMELRDIAILAAQAADEKKATDIVVLDVAETLVITSYFVIATAANDRQARSIADEVETALREKAKMKPIGREGEREATWILLDFGDLVFHVFQPDERGFYRLEKLWGNVPHVDVPGIDAPQAGAAEADEHETDVRDGQIAEGKDAELEVAEIGTPEAEVPETAAR